MAETGEGIKCQNVIKEFMITSTESFKESTILSAWKKSGMQLLNPHIFTKKDFNASFGSSTHPPMLDSFPVCPPSDNNLVPVDGIDGGINDGDNDEGDSTMAGDSDEADGPWTEASQATGADHLLNQGVTRQWLVAGPGLG